MSPETPHAEPEAKKDAKFAENFNRLEDPAAFNLKHANLVEMGKARQEAEAEDRKAEETAWTKAFEDQTQNPTATQEAAKPKNDVMTRLKAKFLRRNRET